MAMRVLVTGGAGFIGSHIAEALAGAGHEPVLLDALVPTAHGGVPEYCRDYELLCADVTDAGALAEALRGVDVVAHQAALVGHGLSTADAPNYAWNNDFGTAMLLAAMYEAGVRRLVLASSMVVYGEGSYRCRSHGDIEPGPRRPADLAAGRYEPRCPVCDAELVSELVDEDSALRPKSTYAATKVAQEHLAGGWARQCGGQVWALRYHNVYGARMPRDTPYAGVASLFRSALGNGSAPTVLEDGRQRRDFVHVSDVARANRLAIETDQSPGAITAVNVCSGEPRTVGELAATLAAALHGPRPVVVGGARPADVRHVVADPSRASALLGFTATIGFSEGIAEFATAPLRDSVPG